MDTYKEPSERLVAHLRKLYKDGPFKAIYDGDPDLIPASKLPALCVLLMNDEHAPASNFEDEVTAQLQIRVVYNKKPDWGVKTDTEDLTDRRIRRIVEERDPATGRYLPTTIKGAITSGLSLDPGSFVQGGIRFELGSVIRSESLMTREGVVTFTIKYPAMIG